MSDQAPLPGTDDKQVIADIDAEIDSMHDRYRELWVEMALEDIDVPDSLQSSFNRTYQQIDSLSKHLQIARLSKMVQQLEMILSKKKTGRKNSESAAMDLESQTGASADSGAHSDVSKLSCARSIPGASASAASFPTIPTIPTARPETDSELTDPCSSGKPGKRTAAQAALSDRGENFTPAAVKNCVLGERLDDRRKRRSLSAAQQMQLQAFITFAINYFREKAVDATTVSTRHTTSEQLVSFYNESLTRTEKEQGREFSMSLFRSNSLQLQILQTSGSVSEAMSKSEEKLSASRMNYSSMSLRRCIHAKPDIADVINWCRDYTIQNRDQKLKRTTIMAAMERETAKPKSSVPNGIKRLRTLFSNGMITMNKLQRLRRLEGNEGSEPGSDANHECDDEDGETTTAAGRDDGEDGGGGGGDGGEAGGADSGGGEADDVSDAGGAAGPRLLEFR